MVAPAVVAEAGNGAHVDVLAAGFLVAALAAVGWVSASRGRGAAGTAGLAGLAGVMVGLGIAVEFYPAVVLSPLFSLRHSASRVVTAVVAAFLTVALAYLPHWLAAGHLVLGYLPAYISEENGPNRSGILQLLLPTGAVAPVTVLLMAVVAGSIAWGQVQDPALASALVLGSLLLLVTPSYPRYALPLVACAVLAGRLEWLAVAVAAVMAYVAASVPPLPTAAYAVAAVVVVIATIRRSSGGVRPPTLR